MDIYLIMREENGKRHKVRGISEPGRRLKTIVDCEGYPAHAKDENPLVVHWSSPNGPVELYEVESENS
jgi:hypothetical protein